MKGADQSVTLRLTQSIKSSRVADGQVAAHSVTTPESPVDVEAPAAIDIEKKSADNE